MTETTQWGRGIFAVMAVILGCAACGTDLSSLGSSSSGSSSGSETGSETTSETTETESGSEVATSKNITDEEGDWEDAATGEGRGDIKSASVIYGEDAIEVTMTMAGDVPTALDSDTILYSLDFLVYDPAKASLESGPLADVAEQVSLAAYSGAGTELSAKHSSASKLSLSAKSFFAAATEDDMTGVSAVQDASDVTTAIDGAAIQMVIPYDRLQLTRDELCNLEVGLMAQVYCETKGHVVDKTPRMQITSGACAAYSRTRCWSDTACQDLISAQLVSKDQCAAIGGSSWGPNASDCTKI